MSASKSEPTCPHANCGCPPDGVHDPYCSAYCANAAQADREEDPGASACSCGHERCRRSQETDLASGEVQTSVGPHR